MKHDEMNTDAATPSPGRVVTHWRRFSLGLWRVPRGDIASAYSASSLPKVTTFTHEGRLYTNGGCAFSKWLHAEVDGHRLIPAAEYRGAESVPYSYEGREVAYRGKLFRLFDAPYLDPEKADAALGRPENHAVALRAARESLVLLKNEHQILPLSKDLKRILVCGPTAKMKETSVDRYGSNGGEVISPLEGIKALLKNSGTEIRFAQGCKVTDKRWPESELFPEPPAGNEAAQIREAVEKAADVDAIVLCLGDSMATIGESKSRTSLDLPGYQTDLARALVKTGKPVVVVLLNGKPASINWINRYVPAILQAWIPGETGGTAIAEALFGDYNPGGKLPVTFPKTVGQVPFNFPFKPGSQASQSRNFDPNGFGDSMAEGALYPFGFGLSYTKFEYSGLEISPKNIPTNGEVTVRCLIKNIGDRVGDEVAQLYFHQTTSSVTTYVLNLCGFERVTLKPGEIKTVSFKLPAADLQIINRAGRRLVEPGEFAVHVGTSSENLLLNGTFNVSGASQ